MSEKMESNSDSSSGRKRKLAEATQQPVVSAGPATTSSQSSSGTTDNATMPRVLIGTNSTSQLTANSVVSDYITLEPLPSKIPRGALPKLSPSELAHLETALQFDSDSEQWRGDWAGNLAYIDKEIPNPQVRSKEKQSFQQSLLGWAQSNEVNVPLVYNLLRHVYHMEGTPLVAKKILACADPTTLSSMEKAIRRTSYDPAVLEADGWTTKKSQEVIGATGGPFLIGDKVRWHGSDAVVIAYVHDQDIGDLWHAMWIDDTEHYETFDLEAEELLEAKRKWDRRQKGSQSGNDGSSRRSSRYAISSDFTVKGIEEGIVLATSYSKGARPGVYWPARVMHASEASESGSQGKRSTSKQKVQLVFLAPYWNSHEQPVRSRRVESLSEGGHSIFCSGPLLQWETVEATDEMIKEYPYEGEEGLDLNQLRIAFRFTGLPKAAFPRYVDSNRLAMSLKMFARRFVKTQVTATERASAGLFDAHPMTVRAPIFPPVILHLPFEFMLSQLPRPDEDQKGGSSDDGHENVEPIIQLASIVDVMKPPNCWGMSKDGQRLPATPPTVGNRVDHRPITTPGSWLGSHQEENGNYPSLELDQFVNDLSSLKDVFARGSSSPSLVALLSNATRLLSQLSEAKDDFDESNRRETLKSLIGSWILLKRQGEDAISSLPNGGSAVPDWQRASERLYKYMTAALSYDGHGNGVSAVLTDAQCNGHRTSNGCFERAVRLPAALKGARLAGAGATSSVPLITSIPVRYYEFVEQDLLMRAHSTAYLKRMKSRCAAAQPDSDVLVLTDDSDGNGGEDTRGTRGTWAAAVSAVAASVAAVDMVVKGECVNAFCATRPPGHHAGRLLHPMKAISNGFCILNSAACAAIYATTAVSEGGLGLSKVAVIDFDVHHGNGTQDILCSTYDPRFLYVSLHAGGAEVNGVLMDDDPNHELHDLGHNPKQVGIYPGRCGNTSPHKGVLNIPLGSRVTSHAVGSALISRVTPAVDAFGPDLIILSAGFDAHKCDPMCLGGLSAEDFGHITEVTCQLAFKSCSGRVISILEGGYGVPCCRPQKDDFLPPTKPAPPESTALETQGPNVMVDPQTSQTLETTNVPQASQTLETTNVPLASETLETTNVLPPPQAPPASKRPQPSKLLDLDEDLPSEMDDQVPYALQRRLEKCHAEGFVECVQEHVKSLTRCNMRK